VADYNSDDDCYDDENDEPDDDYEPVRCPECGNLVYAIADRCPACGYWLSDSDRRAMWTGMQKPLWLRVTAVIVLVAFVSSLFAVAVSVLF
jgi:hypothetical protein